MKKEVLIGLVIIIVVVILSFIILPKTGFAIYQYSHSKILDKDYLENLKLKANVECLQNSQCPEGFECVGNKCITKSEINLCQNIKLFTPTRKLKTGQPINSIREIITDSELPHLLADGDLVELIDNKLTKHFYVQVIYIGENNLEKENGEYSININNKPIYTYRLMFSKSVDFSSENIRGQVLRILGKEYVIDSKSDNNKIILIYDNKKIKLEDEKSVNDIIKESLVNIKRNEDGKIIMFEVSFNIQDKDKSNIKVKENYSDPVFNAIKLSFDGIDNEFADIRLGGNC